MESIENASGCPAIDQLIESSKIPASGYLKWIPFSEFTDVESIEHPTSNQPTYYATYGQAKHIYYLRSSYRLVEMLRLGTVDECTQEFIQEFTKTHSLLPTHKHDNPSDIVQFRRYSVWLKSRNWMIEGFTSDDDNYYLVAKRRFHHYYSRYGFCSACGILRCSPVLCICGHKRLSNEWTSNNKKLDEFITKSQTQTKSPNEAYLEWIPFDHINQYDDDLYMLYDQLPTYYDISLDPLSITDKTDDLFYDKVNDLIMFTMCVDCFN